MKVIWEAADIRAGRRVRKLGSREIWMLGYWQGPEGPKKYALISLVDGMIATMLETRALMAEFLNGAHDLPVELIGEDPESNPDTKEG